MRASRLLVPFTLFTLYMLAACSHASSTVVKFGAAGPLADDNGKANRKGIELARDELNAAADQHYRIDIAFRDDSANGRVAAGVAQDFVNDANVVAVVGHVNSGAMMAAARIYDGNVPAVATSATSPALSGISRWAFRVIPSDSLNGQKVATFMSKLGRRRAAVLYENNAYGRGLADSFRRGFNGEIVDMDPMSDRPGEDLEPFVTYFKQKGVDLVFVAGTPGTGLELLKEARRQQISAEIAGGNGWANLAGNPLADGAYFPTPFNARDSRPDVQGFVAAYEKKFNGEVPTAYAALAYDATKLLAQAVNVVGPNRVKIRDYLAHMDEHPYRGVTGDITFGPDGDPKGKTMSIARISQRAIALAEGGQ